jgi:hypothetical protein
MGSEVANARGRKKGVGSRMGHRVTVGVSGEASLPLPIEAAKPERTGRVTGCVGMDVEADSGAGKNRCDIHC